MTCSVPRRSFLTASLAAAAGSFVASGLSASEQTAGRHRFFSPAVRDGRWWFITPGGEVFFSIALNHIDPSPLRYASAGDLWQRKYGNSMERWL
jgi:hypothetical protein